MKKQLLFLSMIALGATSLYAQTVASFENLTLNQDTIRDGRDSSDRVQGGFKSGTVFFRNGFDTSFGGFWSSGFAISAKHDVSTDSLTTDYTKMYTAITGFGADSTNHYAIGQNDATVLLSDSEPVAKGCYLTNSDYAYLSMKWGDGIGKKFDNNDYFKLHIYGYKLGAVTDSILFSLAQGKSLVSNWGWIDLSTLGEVDSIRFHMTSSDNGQFGMNTPAFFCIDQFKTGTLQSGLPSEFSKTTIRLYPNPATDMITIQSADLIQHITIFNNMGEKVIESVHSEISLQHLPEGLYMVSTETKRGIAVQKLIKANQPN